MGTGEWLARTFSLPVPMPVAPITLAADDSPREGSWLRADPVHVRLDARPKYYGYGPYARMEDKP